MLNPLCTETSTDHNQEDCILSKLYCGYQVQQQKNKMAATQRKLPRLLCLLFSGRQFAFETFLTAMYSGKTYFHSILSYGHFE